MFVFRYTGYTKDIEDAKNGSEEVLVIQPLVSIDLWSLQTFVYTLSLLGIVLLVGSILAQRSIREVDLVGSGEGLILAHPSWNIRRSHHQNSKIHVVPVLAVAYTNILHDWIVW